MWLPIQIKYKILDIFHIQIENSMTANDKKHSKITTETNVVLYSLIKKNISQLLPKSVIQQS